MTPDFSYMDELDPETFPRPKGQRAPVESAGSAEGDRKAFRS